MTKGGEFLLPSTLIPEAFVLEDADETQRGLRVGVSKFVRDRVIPRAAELEDHAKNAEASRQLLLESAELGLLGLEIPDDRDGLGLDPVTATLALEMLGVYGSWGCTIAAHAGIGTFPLRYFGTAAQKDQYLARLVSGEMPAAYALTESNAGSNPAAMRMKAVPTDGGWRLSGEKQFITNAGFAKLLTVYAKLPDDGPEDFTAFLVERDWPGVSVGAEEKKIGIWGSSTASVTLDNVFVPEANLLGEPHQGKKIALNVLNLGRFKLGVICLGAGRECLRMAVEYSKQREQKDTIIKFGLVRQRLAGMAMRVAAMEAIVYRTALLLSNALKGIPEDDPVAATEAIKQYAMECSIVKVYCSEAMFWIAAQNVRAHGGNGFVLDYGPARFFLDAIINEIFEGTNDINRQVIFETLIRRRIVNRWYKQLSTWTSLGPLNSAKRATLKAITRALRQHRRGIEHHQVLLGAASDSIIDLYVLDSLGAAYAKHPTVSRGAALHLLERDLYPAIRERAAALHEDREPMIDAIVTQLAR